jgi:hypothetical protein
MTSLRDTKDNEVEERPEKVLKIIIIGMINEIKEDM